MLLFIWYVRYGGNYRPPDVTFRYHPDVAVVLCIYKSDVAARYKPYAAVVVYRYQPDVVGKFVNLKYAYALVVCRYQLVVVEWYW